MAYQTGTSSGTADLLDKLNIFAVANGWTLNRRDANSLSISKNGAFQNLWEDGTEIKMRLATGYDNAQAWNLQPGGNLWTQRSREMSGSFTRYHFFGNGDYIYVVVEVDPGLYKHMAFGTIHKSSNYDGGQFSCAVILDNAVNPHGLFGCNENSLQPIYNANNTIRLVADGQTQWRQLNQNASGETAFVIMSSEYWHSPLGWPMYQDWYMNSPNTATQQNIFIPIHLFTERAASLFSPIGFVDDLRLCNMQAIDPGATVNIGADQWLVFPEWKKGVSPSNNNGYAYKKIV